MARIRVIKNGMIFLEIGAEVAAIHLTSGLKWRTVPGSTLTAPYIVEVEVFTDGRLHIESIEVAAEEEEGT